MKNIRNTLFRSIMIGMVALMAFSFSSCGRTGVYGGIHHDFAYDWDGDYLESVPYYKRPYVKNTKKAKKQKKQPKATKKQAKKAHLETTHHPA